MENEILHIRIEEQQEEINRLKRVIEAYVDMLVEATGKGEGDLIGEMSKKVEARLEAEKHFPELKELNEGLDRIENSIDDFLNEDEYNA